MESAALPVRRRQMLGMDENARNIADLALATCEEKLAETRQRRRPQQKQPQHEEIPSNPFLARLGTPFVVSRSIQGASTTYVDNIHPLRDHHRSKQRRNIQDSQDESSEKSEWTKWKRRLSPLDAPTYTLFILFLTLIVVPKGMKVLQDRLLKWHDLSDRQLSGRRCIMNLFVDKQKPDEWNPDHGAKTSIIVPETYRTKGQLKLINRMIGSIADSFRTALDKVQHVVFVGVRDGGHLAQSAHLYWPPRGTIRTRLHMFAAPDDDDSGLSYQFLHSLEERFDSFDEFTYIYDEKGNLAGVEEEEEEDEDNDDDGLNSQDDDALKEDKQKQQRRRLPNEKNLDQIGFEELLFRNNDGDEEEEEEEQEFENIIPYFHIDGLKMASQMKILEKARPLLEKKTIAAIGIEHSPDLDVNQLKDFFLGLEYKTFMLGLRQLTRVDNVCPETLENVFDHPTFTTPSLLMGRQKRLGIPPFFIALPKGRHSLEEMTIQTMYDLFSGAGGGGQVKTANDRKAPGKK
mmetsp:Transcript_22692/g.34308  ORF Transcript_22692/g.34308 Transcript_22692/m.34308 type:complete len:517 (-) Transcript_22692:36-1586(-)